VFLLLRSLPPAHKRPRSLLLGMSGARVPVLWFRCEVSSCDQRALERPACWATHAVRLGLRWQVCSSRDAFPFSGVPEAAGVSTTKSVPFKAKIQG